MVAMPNSECSICNCDYNIEEDGGINGLIGNLPINLCQWCYNGMVDIVETVEPSICVECPECGHEIKLKVDMIDD
jgi:hypothetical protein